MGCSDVSEFEHIYGQIFTTPSCLYDRLLTWTRMVDFNTLIVWNTLIDICFPIKSSLWALTAAYTKFRRIIWSMTSCGYRSRSPMCTVTSSKRRETSLGIVGKAESIQLCDFRVGQATTGAEAQFWLRQPWRNLFFPISSLRLLPLPHFNEGLGYYHGKIVELKMICRYVLEHFDGLVCLIIFPWNKKVNSPPHFLIFCRPRISVAHFASPGVPLDAPGCDGSEG